MDPCQLAWIHATNCIGPCKKSTGYAKVHGTMPRTNMSLSWGAHRNSMAYASSQDHAISHRYVASRFRVLGMSDDFSRPRPARAEQSLTRLSTRRAFFLTHPHSSLYTLSLQIHRHHEHVAGTARLHLEGRPGDLQSPQIRKITCAAERRDERREKERLAPQLHTHLALSGRAATRLPGHGVVEEARNVDRLLHQDLDGLLEQQLRRQ
jgi:hypothetical protein